MARPIERIEQDIAALEEAVRAIATELQSTYTSYISALGQGIRQQLILASYHLCTQGYPQAFLSLSFNQRQHLQQDIRKLGQEAAEQLLVLVEAAPSSNPSELAQWQQKLEMAIVYTLKTLSRDTNRLLQQAEVLPKKLPEQLLEVAVASSEATTEAMPGPPNLLNLVVETQPDEEAEEPTPTPITAIHLRLSEIEFADTTVRSGRNKIRDLLGKASKLSREYHSKQRERSVAEAEAAWRLSWFE